MMRVFLKATGRAFGLLFLFALCAGGAWAR